MKEQYVERRGGGGRAAHDHQPTVRLLAMAAQLASRLPLVAAGRRAVTEIETQTAMTAYMAVPCYADVLAIAATGAGAVRPWATLPANADAAGRVLLAHRDAWRRSLASVEPEVAMDDEDAAAILTQGFASLATPGDRFGSLAVVVPQEATPIAAIAVRGASAAVMAQQDALVALLERAATQVARETEITTQPRATR
jgi:DNA-binding IclR family transcriptional regulator